MISIKEILTDQWKNNINTYLNGDGFDLFRNVLSDLSDNGIKISNYQTSTDLLYTFILNDPKNQNTLTPAFDIEDCDLEHILKLFVNDNKLYLVILAKNNNKFSKSFMSGIRRVLVNNNFKIEQITINCVKATISCDSSTPPSGSSSSSDDDSDDHPLPVLGTKGVFLAH